MSKRIKTDNGPKCNEIFKKVIEIGQTIDLTKPLPAIRPNTVFNDQKSVIYRLFASEDKDHTFIDDEGCRHIGILQIVLPNPKHEKGREVDIMFAFGDTEVTATARDVDTRHTAQCHLDFTSMKATLSNKP